MPFLMYPSGRHFIIYKKVHEKIIIVTILHQVRNIENILFELSEQVTSEIEEVGRIS